ncbi:hypothetical protein TWF970_007185 [Orbilia oligospora]|uniref:Uncharacterized protein n=1 Tax=Orbilia oligospora TaxID=2813651 RepID=A0A7C8VEE9_ORBOL|nr:hypothetical protein TWF970_007185 [Orbilia oligospora]
MGPSAARVQGWTPQNSTSQLLPLERRIGAYRLPWGWEDIPVRTPPESEADPDTLTRGASSTRIPVQCIDPPGSKQEFYKLEDLRGGNILESTIVKKPDCAVLLGSKHGKWKHRYLVSRDVLCASSSVFSNVEGTSVLNRTSPSSSTGGVKTQTRYWISLAIDCRSEDLKLIFRIIHFTTNEQDMDIKFDTLRKVARICKAFSWGRALQSWNHVWLQKYESKALFPGYEGWMEIADIIGTKKHVEKLVELLANECSEVSEEMVTRYTSDRRDRVSTQYWPDNQRARVFERRKRKIRHLYASLNFLDRTFRHGRTDGKACPSKTCLDLAYGSFLRSVEANGLRNFLDAGGSWGSSAGELETQMLKITFQTLGSVYITHSCAMGGFRDGFAACIRSQNLLNDNGRFCQVGSTSNGGFEFSAEAQILQAQGVRVSCGFIPISSEEERTVEICYYIIIFCTMGCLIAMAVAL